MFKKLPAVKLQVPVKVMKLKSYLVTINGETIEVRAVSSADAFNLAASHYRKQHNMAPSFTVLASSITLDYKQIGAKA